MYNPYKNQFKKNSLFFNLLLFIKKKMVYRILTHLHLHIFKLIVNNREKM